MEPAIITIDALPDEVFYGQVSFVAPLPDSANQWLNPDLKVYRVEVVLTGDTLDLRPGMSCAVEIVVSEIDDEHDVDGLDGAFLDLERFERGAFLRASWLRMLGPVMSMMVE